MAASSCKWKTLNLDYEEVNAETSAIHYCFDNSNPAALRQSAGRSVLGLISVE
jgi:hypothetical protein